MVNARHHLRQRFITQGTGVEQWGHQRRRSFTPVVFAATVATLVLHVEQAARGEDRAVPRARLANGGVAHSMNTGGCRNRAGRIVEQHCTIGARRGHDANDVILR